jgi:hypothetical protein
MFNTLSENCIFYISQLYEFSHRLGHQRPRRPKPYVEARPFRAESDPNSGDPFRDIDPVARSIYEAVKRFTVTGPAAVFAVCDAVRHVVRADIPGAFVECGVFMGGSSMAAALMAKHFGAALDIHLFDTFEGMPPPTERDAFVHASRPVLGFNPKTGEPWTRCDEATVRANMAKTGYDLRRLC